MNTATIMDMMFNTEMIARGIIGGKADMTEKRFECDKGSRIIIDNETKLHYIMTLDWECSLVTKLLNRFADENEQLKKDVDYWKQVASQYSNELNVFEHCKKYKTECKDIHWSSD